MASLDKAGNYDLGVFPLRHLVQSRPIRTILRALAALLTYRFAHAESCGRHSAGRRLGRLHLVRAKSADRRNDVAVAASRTEFARCRTLADAIAGAQLPQSLGLSYLNVDKGRFNKRPRHRYMRARDSPDAPARATATGLPAPTLGDLGQPDWIASTSLRGCRYNHDTS